MHDTDPNMRGNSRRWIIQEVEASLRRLQTDWIDLYQIHRWDPATDHDETLGALTDLQRAGKIRYLGSSTYPPSAIVEAQWVAEAARPLAVRLRATPVFDPGARHRDRGAADLRALRPGRDPVEPTRRRLAVRQIPQGRRRRQATAPSEFPSGTTCRCQATSRNSTQSSSSRSSPSRRGSA